MSQNALGSRFLLLGVSSFYLSLAVCVLGRRLFGRRGARSWREDGLAFSSMLIALVEKCALCVYASASVGYTLQDAHGIDLVSVMER